MARNDGLETQELDLFRRTSGSEPVFKAGRKLADSRSVRDYRLGFDR
jgi:hypothetical protein